jgi:hypothetical protein
LALRPRGLRGQWLGDLNWRGFDRDQVVLVPSD